MKNIVLFASGNGSNVQRIAEYFADSPTVNIVLLICNKADAYVLERAKKLNINTLLIDKKMFYETGVVVETLQKLHVDMVVLAGFLWLIPKNLIEAFPQKIINIHPALLPKYGGKGMYGMYVHKAVTENKETHSGITVHYVNANYDEGNIIFQEKCRLSADDTPEDVAEKVHALEYAHYPIIIEKLLQQSSEKVSRS
ncbi:MAG: phosphoribosylglycinamide formyltransferase [Bacteroidales bacterium]|jgi:phosphoribosylglycinamide formyltransferase-1|nr:phosphoribosylglycinamide formyltransferase [Bacteroidales bacterium]